MTTIVYQFSLGGPLSGERAARQQMAAAHRYANDLIAIERGRRDAMRAVHDTPEVAEAIAVVKAATRSTRKAAVKTLWAARREAEKRACVVDEASIAAATSAIAALPKDAPTRERSRLRSELRQARAAAGDEHARIQLLDESIRRDARALAECHWGTYLTIEASADQARKAPLYADDHVTPASPRFRRGGFRGHLPEQDARSLWWCAPSQVGMHVQGRTCRTSDVLSERDTWVRLESVEPLSVRDEHHVRRAVLALRVDADTWVRWPIRMHREIPDAARWSWVHVSCRPQRGASGREEWSVEITVDDEAPRSRELAAESLSGAIAVELMWAPIDDEDGGGMRVAMWEDSEGQRGQVVLPRKLVRGLGEVPSGIRAVRSLLLNELKPKLQTLLRECREPMPEWLRQAGNTLHLWRSASRFVELARRWRATRTDAARPGYELLDAWEQRDTHLDDYEDGTRARSLRWRREVYRTLAAQWSRRYAAVLLPDRDLSREARWGEDSERRFLAAPQELRGCLRQSFGDGAQDVPWRGPHGVIDDGDEDADVPLWLEMAIERWRDAPSAGGARNGGNGPKSKEVRRGAWARRHAAAAERDEQRGSARKAAGNDAE